MSSNKYHKRKVKREWVGDDKRTENLRKGTVNQKKKKKGRVWWKLKTKMFFPVNGKTTGLGIPSQKNHI